MKIAILCIALLVLWGLVSPIVFQEGGMIGYSHSTLSVGDKGLSPLSLSESTGHRHILGTDRLGRDTLAGIGNGLRITLAFAISAALLALLIGTIIGFISSYQYIRLYRVRLWKVLLIGLVGWYLCYLIGVSLIGSDLDFTFFTVSYTLFMILIWRETANRGGYLSADEATTKVIEVWKTVPTLLVLIILASMVTVGSYVSLTLIIATLLWTSYARLLRGEVIRLSKQDYIKSALASGASTGHIYIKHVLPNVIAPIVARFCFGLISIILLEATLSFLGVGVPIDQVTLGSMVKDSTERISYWWLAVFPGIILVALLLSLNTIGSWYLRKVK